MQRRPRPQLTDQEIHEALTAIGREIRPAWAGPRITRYDRPAVHEADEANVDRAPRYEPFNWDAADDPR